MYTVIKQHTASKWLYKNLFSSYLNTFLTLLSVFFLLMTVPAFLNWALFQATFFGDTREACQQTGACWPFISNRILQLIYGFYPEEQIWRVNVCLVLLATAIISCALINKRRLLVIVLWFLTYPIIATILLYGNHFGLMLIETHLWGGLFLTIILASTGIIVAFPISLLLALGRRSQLPVFRVVSTLFIELVRGVPLISVLFMASVMFPLFVPDYLTIDKLLRALIGIVLFQSAYLAEVIRGGLQAIPRGQYEAASSLGLNYWQSSYYIILPQALKLVIPGIVNTQIALLKDTTLVLIIGLFDFLGIIQAAITDPNWLGYAIEGYVFCAFVYWVICFCMSQYSQHLERTLHRGQTNG